MFVFGVVDKEKVNGGAWFEVEGQRFLVARHENARYQALLESLKKRHKNAIKEASLASAIMEEIWLKAISQSILLDWEGVNGPDGKPVPYSANTGMQMLQDSPNFRDMIVAFSKEEEAFFAA